MLLTELPQIVDNVTVNADDDCHHFIGFAKFAQTVDVRHSHLIMGSYGGFMGHIN